jgi:hypothetical protein
MIPALAIVGVLVGASAAVRGVVLVVRGVRHGDADSASLDVIRGIRGIAIAVGTMALAAGLVFEQRWLVAFGLVFLLEELYETGVVAGVLRAARRRNATREARRSPQVG